MKKFFVAILVLMVTVTAGVFQSSNIVSASTSTNSGATAATATATSTIETNATSQLEVAPDIAYVNTEISIIDEIKNVATSANKSATAALIKALTDAGIPVKDIKTTGYYVSTFIDRVPVDPQQANPVYKDIKKFQVRATFKITVRKITEVGDVLEKLTNVDQVNISNVTYGLSNISSYKKEAIKQAVVLAKENIAFAADNANVKLYKLQTMSVEFNNNPYTSYPYYTKAEARDSVYQNPEDIKIIASVHMVYIVK
jgi:uncharacterized protein YggE